jgi:hypothetical protein
MKDMCAFVAIEVTLMTFTLVLLTHFRFLGCASCSLRQLCLQVGSPRYYLDSKDSVQRVIQKGN